MIKTITTTLICVSLALSGEAIFLPQTDTKQWMVLGDSLLKQGRSKEAVSYLKKAAEAYEQSEDWINSGIAIFKLSMALSNSNQFDEARATLDRGLELNKHLSSESLEYANQEARLLGEIGDIFLKTGNLDSASFYFHEGLKFLKKNETENEKEIASSYNNLGRLEFAMGLYDEALEHFNLTLEIRQRILPENDESLAISYNNVGVVYMYMGDYLKVIPYFLKAIEVQKSNYGTSHPSLAGMYNNVQIIYQIRGEYDRALEYGLKALEIREEHLTRNHAETAGSYENIGLLYKQVGDPRKAHNYMREAYSIELQVLGSDHPQTASSCNNLGTIFLDLELYDSAIFYLEKALTIRKKTIGEEHPDAGITVNNMGSAYLLRGEPKVALSLLEKALVINKNALGPVHPDVARVYLQMGKAHLDLKQFEKALKNFELSNLSNKVVVSSKGDLLEENILAKDVFLESLQHTGLTLKIRGESIESQEDLKAALQVFDSCDGLIDDTRRSQLRFQDKINFSRSASRIYKLAVETAFLMYNQYGDKAALERAFYFSEKAKAVVLSETLSEETVKSFAGVSEELLQLEKSTKAVIAFNQSEINNLMSTKSDMDTTRLLNLRNKVFESKHVLDSVKDIFKAEYADYYELVYEENKHSLSALKNLLRDGQLVLEYFEGNSSIFLFSLTNKEFAVHEIKNVEKIKSDISSFLEALNDRSARDSNEFLEFQSKGYALYHKIVRPALNHHKEVTHLTIIPSPVFAVVPWEILLLEPKGDSYSELPYLMRQYSMSYAYSSKFLGRKKKNTSGYSEEVLAFSPSYVVDDEIVQKLKLEEISREALAPLKWNQTETAEIGKLFSGTVISGEAATEKKFKEEANRYQILHLAMHALVDHEESMNSKLVFTQNKDSIEDGMLHTFEIFNMKLPAELVVLSACNTGIGEVQEGEGIMSLARAFAYAGVPSLVMSHWNVNDASTAQLMTSFYEHLANGERKDEALRNAKLDFLQEAHPVLAHPFYWGGFVVVGDTDPLDQNRSGFRIALVISLFGVSLLFLWLRKRNKL